MRKIILLAAADTKDLGNYAGWCSMKQNPDGSVYIHTDHRELIGKALHTLPHPACSASRIPPEFFTHHGIKAPTEGTCADVLSDLYGDRLISRVG
jgi:hypothetical protein